MRLTRYSTALEGVDEVGTLWRSNVLQSNRGLSFSVPTVIELEISFEKGGLELWSHLVSGKHGTWALRQDFTSVVAVVYCPLSTHCHRPEEE